MGTGGSINAGAGTIFTMEGNTSTNGSGGAIVWAGAALNFTMKSPQYFDFRNNRPGGGYVLYGAGASTFTTTESDLSVWENGSNLDGTPTATWTLFNYTLTGAEFNTISSSSISNFNSTTYLGASKYSRMSANNVSAVVDELRVPTNADKYIYGHVSVPEGLDESRDAWTDEVYVTVEVKNTDGDVVSELEGTTVGANSSSNGLSVYGEAERAGIFKILYDPDNDGEGDYLPVGYTVDVVSAYRSSGGTITEVGEANVHKSKADDIQTSTVTTRDVTPPSPVVLNQSSQTITTNTTQISGTSDEIGATIRVKVNGEWVTDDSAIIQTATVDANGKWTFLLPTLATGDVVAIYASDNRGASEVSDVKNPPDTSGELGNINPDEDTDYHDAKFLARPAVTVTYTGTLTLVAPDNISFGDNAKILPRDTVYPVEAADNDYLGVIDTRNQKSSWTLTAALVDELYNPTYDSTLSLVYMRDGVEKVLSDNAEEIYEHINTDDSIFSVSGTWYGDSGDGLYVKANAGQARVGEYKGTIKWTLADTPANEE